MKITQIISNLSLGGAQRILFELCKYLNGKSEIELSVISIDSGEYITDFEKEGIKVIDLKRSQLVNPLILTNIITCIRKLRPEIVHTHLQKADFYGRVAARICGIGKIFSTYHGYSTGHTRDALEKPGILDKIDDLTIRFSNAELIAVSNTVRQFLVNRSEFNASRVNVIYNGIDSSEKSKSVMSIEQRINFRKKFGALPEHKVILISGRIEPAKGQTFFLKSVLPVVASDKTIKIIFIGKGSDEDELKELISVNGLQDNVFLEGFVMNPDPYYDICDIVAVPSFWEGFGLTAIEGMVKGKIVIAADVGGLSEVINDGKTGFLFRPRDSGHLLKTLNTLLENFEGLSEMRAKAVEEVKQRFDLNATSEKYLELYKRY